MKRNKANKVKTLWGQEFSIAKDGLDETEVVGYVENLMGRYEEAEDKLQHFSGLPELVSSAILEAERLSGSIREELKQKATVEAASIVSEAGEQARQILDDAERSANLRTHAATKLISDLIKSTKNNVAMAERPARDLVLQISVDIQSALESAIDQASGRLFLELDKLEKKYQDDSSEDQFQEPDDIDETDHSRERVIADLRSYFSEDGGEDQEQLAARQDAG